MPKTDVIRTESRPYDDQGDARAQAGLLKGKWLAGQLGVLADDFLSDAEWPDAWHKKNFKESVTRCYAAFLKDDAMGITALRKLFEKLVMDVSAAA
jgi:hypothetical protein